MAPGSYLALSHITDEQVPDLLFAVLHFLPGADQPCQITRYLTRAMPDVARLRGLDGAGGPSRRRPGRR